MKTSLLAVLLCLVCGVHLDAGVEAKDIPAQVIVINHANGKKEFVKLPWHKDMILNTVILSQSPTTEFSGISFFLVRDGVVKKVDENKDGELELRPWDIILMEIPHISWN